MKQYLKVKLFFKFHCKESNFGAQSVRFIYVIILLPYTYKEMINMGLNFDFLEYTNPTLYECGSKMEENIFSDKDASAQYGSDFLNALIKEVYAKEGMTYVYKSFFTRNMDELEQEGVITPEIQAKFEKAKLLRDYIMEKDGSIDRIFALLSTLVELASWFFNKYERSN